jgi:hypothetical protein
MRSPLESIRKWLAQVEYDPRSISFGAGLAIDADLLSLESQVFVELWTRRESAYLTLFDLHRGTWAEKKLLDEYRALPDAEKSKILAIATFSVHELTHHFDLLLTPYGANFHGKIFREYHWMESELAAPLAEFIRKTAAAGGARSQTSLRRLFRALDRKGPRIKSAFSSRDAKFLKWCRSQWQPSYEFFETFSNHPESTIASPEDLGEPNADLTLFGQRYPLVNVNRWFWTVGLGVEGVYLSPLAILEARAMANSLAWIAHNFDDEEEGVAEAKRYLDAFYAPDLVRPEYGFLLDLFASAVSVAPTRFSELAAGLKRMQLVKLTGTISACCWYALFAMPPTEDNSLVMCSPAYRLIQAIRQVEIDAQNKVRPEATNESTVAAFYRRIDERVPHLWPIARICRETLRWLDEYARVNEEKTQNPALRRHFAAVLGAVRRCLAVRGDYGIPPGLVTGGRPFYGPGFEMDAPDYVTRYLLNYRIPDEVFRWNVLREQVLYKPRWKDSADPFRDFFIPHEGIAR